MYVLIATMMGILRNLNSLKKEHLTVMKQYISKSALVEEKQVFNLYQEILN